MTVSSVRRWKPKTTAPVRLELTISRLLLTVVRLNQLGQGAFSRGNLGDRVWVTPRLERQERKEMAPNTAKPQILRGVPQEHRNGVPSRFKLGSRAPDPNARLLPKQQLVLNDLFSFDPPRRSVSPTEHAARTRRRVVRACMGRISRSFIPKTRSNDLRAHGTDPDPLLRIGERAVSTSTLHSFEKMFETKPKQSLESEHMATHYPYLEPNDRGV
ncbi:hypothetical protein B0H14DRAFT_2596588 [Mycena olivaceomarginata]|nr:hypothetical protein B0H14DRAFT_2596588 [Mycena olivaceomarginata]